jgi:hypothetical protein
MQPKFDRNKNKIEILTLYPGYDGMVQKPSHATVPLKGMYYNILLVFLTFKGWV